MTDHNTLPVTQEDRDAAKALLDAQAIRYHRDGTFRDWDNTVQAFARHRLAATPALSVNREAIERAVKVCPQCEGEGSYADGLDEAACTTECTRCCSNGWIADADAILSLPASPASQGDEERTIEILRRALAWHGDPQRLATTREEWQQEVDAAIVWVKENPEPDRPSFSSLAFRTSPVGSDDVREARFYIDCEFDGHGGPLLSIALVEDGGRSVHIEADVQARDPWVLANVVPLLDKHDATDCTRVAPNEVGDMIRWFIGDCKHPVIIADSPVDIGRFCAALSTGPDGGWASAAFARMTFEVHNVDCYPTTLEGAVQHNAWWDAMALRATLTPVSPLCLKGVDDAK